MDQRDVQTAAWVSAAVNIGLTIAKGWIGLAAGSRALVADAVHSAADLVGSLAIIIGLRIARKPPDEDHPYGHGKAELISAAFVALLLILAGLDVGYGSLTALLGPPSVPGVDAAIAAFGAIVIKEAMFRYTYALGKRQHSKSLIATAYDHRSDVFSSIAALVGIVLSLVGHYEHWFWLLHMDAVAGLAVALLVIKMGGTIVWDSLQTLMDRVVEGEDLNPYREFMERIEGVERVNELRVRDHGHYVIVDVKIMVNGSITVQAGHEIASEVKYRLMEAFPRVQDVLVHVNPTSQKLEGSGFWNG